MTAEIHLMKFVAKRKNREAQRALKTNKKGN